MTYLALPFLPHPVRRNHIRGDVSRRAPPPPPPPHQDESSARHSNISLVSLHLVHSLLIGLRGLPTYMQRLSGHRASGSWLSQLASFLCAVQTVLQVVHLWSRSSHIRVSFFFSPLLFFPSFLYSYNPLFFRASSFFLSLSSLSFVCCCYSI